MPMQPREFRCQANLAEREQAEANPAQRRAWPVPSGGLIRGAGADASAGGPSKLQGKQPLPVPGVLMREGLPVACAGRDGRRHRRAARATVIAGPHRVGAGWQVEHRTAESQGRFRLGVGARWAGAAAKV